MGKFNNQKNKIKILLNKTFYTRDSILNTSKIYKDFIKLEITEEENYYSIIIELKNDDYTIEEIKKEFINYTIAQEHQNKIKI